MKKYFVLGLALLLFSFCHVQAGFFDDYISGSGVDNKYDQEGLGLQEGIDLVKGGITDLETERSATEFIQDTVIYLLSFISIVAVVYIIYAGFQILIGGGDEEKVKKSRQTIIYVLLGIVVIWLAWPITNLILGVLNNS